jgi:hypothetical protein
MTTKQRLFCAALIAITACGGTQAPETSVSDPAPTTAAAPETTTTTIPPTTTTTEATTTTTVDPFAQAAVVIDEIQTEEGWRFQVAVIPTGKNPEASPGGCIEIAPPDQTNLTFDVSIINLIADRSAPSPQFVLSSNLVGDGTVVDSEPFAEETIRAGDSGAEVEVTPAEPGTSCILASGAGSGYQVIDPGGTFTFEATMGPIVESSVGSFKGGIRVFSKIGTAIEASFGSQPGSGEVLGERDLTR